MGSGVQRYRAVVRFPQAAGSRALGQGVNLSCEEFGLCAPGWHSRSVTLCVCLLCPTGSCSGRFLWQLRAGGFPRGASVAALRAAGYAALWIARELSKEGEKLPIP